MEIRYVKEHGVFMANTPEGAPRVQKLLGARVHVDTASEQNGWVAVRDVPDAEGNFHSGFIETSLLSSKQQLKIFYLDVGQGDAALIEAEKAVVVIDAGPNATFHGYLKKRLAALQRADQAVGLPQRTRLSIDAVFISHFDKDHYQGLVAVLKDARFEIGTLFHNGLPRYADGADKDLDLGTVVKHTDGTRSITADFTGIASARAFLATNDFKTGTGRDNNFAKFLSALVTAHDAGRLDSVQRLIARDPSNPEVIEIGDHLEFEVLGPVTTKQTGPVRLRAFPNPEDITDTNLNPAPSDSHTINGNSIVLRLSYKKRRFLFGGDLNLPAQRYLRERYGASSKAFRVDVNKACHHGSSDFELAFLKQVVPKATVFSSGDEGGHDHPLPDAIGAAARNSRGRFPLVFSTELARENLSGGKKRLGHINARSNGKDIVIAQKKERPRSSKKVWHAFRVPYAGPFSEH